MGNFCHIYIGIKTERTRTGLVEIVGDIKVITQEPMENFPLAPVTFVVLKVHFSSVRKDSYKLDQQKFSLNRFKTLCIISIIIYVVCSSLVNNLLSYV